MPRVFQPVPNTVEVTVQGSLDSQLVENKYYAQAAATVTMAMVTELASICNLWARNVMLLLLPPQYTFTRVIARDISTASSFEVIDATGAGTAGSDTGNALPNNVTLAVHRATGLSGKKAKSRIYWPAVAQPELASENTISSTFATNIVDALDDLREAVLAGSTTSWKYGYPERIINGVKLTTGIFIEVLAHSLVDFLLDSARGRLPGHGV